MLGPFNLYHSYPFCSKKFQTIYIYRIGRSGRRRPMSCVHVWHFPWLCIARACLVSRRVSHSLVCSVLQPPRLRPTPAAATPISVQMERALEGMQERERTTACSSALLPVPVDTSTTIAALLVLSLRHLFCAPLSMHCFIKGCTRPENNTVSMVVIILQAS